MTKCQCQLLLTEATMALKEMVICFDDAFPRTCQPLAFKQQAIALAKHILEKIPQS